MHLIKHSLLTLATLLVIASDSTICHAKDAEQGGLQQDFTSVAQKAIPAVVSIQVKTKSLQNSSVKDSTGDSFNDDFFQRFFGIPLIPQTPEMEMGQASGFIVAPDGYVITNSHVVKNATEIEVTLNDKRHLTAKVIGQDPSTDVAVLKIDATDLPYLKLGNSDDIQIGQWAIAIGTPLGLEASLTVGVISAKGRNNLDIARIEDFIQTDAAINRGNSGGPLLNLRSEVIGMNTAIVSNNGGGGYMGIGFAIPSNIIKNDFEQLKANGSVARGYIGVVLQQVDTDLAQALGLDKAEGALVADVSKDSPAEKAGIKQGDVILKYDQHSFSSIGALRNAIALMNPGSKVTLTILRKDKTSDNIIVEVGNFPQGEKEAPAAAPKENKLGIEIQELTPEQARSLGYTDQKGVIISKVQSGSAAAWAGLKKGTLIVSINQQPVTNVDSFYKLLESSDPNKPLLLLVKQGEITRFISIRVK
jgi:serine protease Do